MESNNEYIKMDYSLETAEERNEKVKEIIANTPPEKLTPLYLSKMADYLVTPITKQEKKERKILTDNRLVTIKKKRETSYEGLITKLEQGENGLYNLIRNDKNIILSPKKEITQKDLETIPGLKELRDAIKEVKAAAAKATGKKKYLLTKQAIDMMQDQYVLKNSFRQPIYSKNTIKSLAKVNLDEHIYIGEDGEPYSDARINLFTPAHVVALLCNYSALKEETWDNFNSDIRWLLLDLEKIIDKALKDKFPMYYDLLIYKIDGKQNIEIQELLYQDYGIKHSVEYISSLWRKKIPKLICEQAKKDWIEWHYTIEEKGKWKRCSRCGQIKLAHNYFFSKNSTSKDKFYSICKECRNKKKK